MTDNITIARPPAAIRKAAILIATLDPRTADELLDRMSPEQAAQVRQAIRELEDIRPKEQDAIIREFIASGETASADAGGGVELDASLAQKLRSPQGYDHLRSATEPKPVPFRSVCDIGVEALVRQLERHHPQLVAVVMAHLPASRAAEVAKRLTPKLQAEVLRRVAELDPADPEVIRDIEQELEQLLSGEIRAARNRDTGLSTVAAILAASGTDRDQLLHNLAQHEQEFAQMLGTVVESPTRHMPVTRPQQAHSISAPRGATRRGSKSSSEHADHSRTRSLASPRAKQFPEVPPTLPVNPDNARSPEDTKVRAPVPEIVFEELTHLNDDEWASLIRAVEPQIVLLALTGASEELVARITRQLPSRESRRLRKRLEQVGPIRLADIDQAQRHVARRAAQLAAQGQIRLPERKSFAAAA